MPTRGNTSTPDYEITELNDEDPDHLNADLDISPVLREIDGPEPSYFLMLGGFCPYRTTKLYI